MVRVEHHIKACESTAIAPCPQSLLPVVVGIKIFCQDGFVVVERTIINRISTPLPLNRCHVLMTVVSEFIYTNKPCKPEDPMPDPETWEFWWQVAVQDVSVPFTEPAPEFPKVTFEPSQQGVCYPGYNIKFETECVCEGVICTYVITRVVTWVNKWPVSPTHCHVMTFVTRQVHVTNIPCLPGEKLSDWMTEEEITSIWDTEYAESPDIPFDDGTVRPDGWNAGRELDVPRFLTPAVKNIREQEKQAGVLWDGSQRSVRVLKINDLAADYKTLESIEAGKEIKLVIGIEGSDFTSAITYQKQSKRVKDNNEILY